jgi:hypothetical protein
MRDNERSKEENIDPPENQGGSSNIGTEDESDESAPSDPPSNANTTLSDL